MPFRFQCFKVLKRSLGESDASTEVTAIALKYLFEYLEEPVKNDKLDGLSKRYNIYVNSFDTNLMSSRTFQLQILAVYEHTEEFLCQLQKESPSMRSSTQRDKEERLSWIWRNLPKSKKKEEEACAWKDIFDYYRKVRNEFLHSLGTEEELDGAVQPLQEKVKELAYFSKLAAPDRYSEIGFDDVILFSRTVKLLAAWLCESLRPSNEQIAEMFCSEYRRKNDKPITVYKRHSAQIEFSD